MRRMKKYIACALSAAMIMSSAFAQGTVVSHAEEQDVEIEVTTEDTETLSDVDETLDENNSSDEENSSEEENLSDEGDSSGGDNSSGEGDSSGGDNSSGEDDSSGDDSGNGEAGVSEGEDDADEGEDDIDEEDDEDENAEFEYTTNDDGGITITGYNKSDKEVTIPGEIDGIKVTAIGSFAFSECDSLTSVTIPDSVTSIGSDAFSECDSLTTVIIPDSVTSIGSYAFSECYNLTSITIPGSVTSIGAYAFYDCEKLSDVIISDGVVSIGASAFVNCEMTTVTIPDSVTSIGKSAFSGCEVTITCSKSAYAYEYAANNGIDVNLTDHDVADDFGEQDNFKYWINTAASEVTILKYTGEETEIVIPDSIKGYNVTKIRKGAFEECDEIKSVKIPGTVTSIGESTFAECGGLTNVEFSEGLISIGAGAFAYTGITSVKFPESLQSIGQSAFAECSKLSRVEFTGITCDIGKDAFSYDGALTSVKLPSGLTSINDNMFSNCKKLSEIEFPDNLTSIGEFSFDSCGFTSLKLPEGLTSIGAYAFDNCSELTEIDLPDSLRDIGERAFDSCGLTSLKLPNGLTYIDDLAFWGCKNLASVEFPASLSGIGNSVFSNCGLTSVNIPATLTSVGFQAFGYCEELTTLNISDGVLSLSPYEFAGCSKLTEINIPESLTDIQNNSFLGCDAESIVVDADNPVYDSRDNCNAIIGKESNTLILGCKNTVIPDTVTRIGENAFYNCKELTSVKIPENVTAIASGAFAGCSGISSIEVAEGNTAYDSRNNCNAIISENGELILGCNNTEIPDGVTKICNGAFYGCTGLTGITIPDTVTSIEYNAFNGCSGLTNITIPEGVTDIDDGVFRGCSSLANITIQSKDVDLSYSEFAELGDVIILCYRDSKVYDYVVEHNMLYKIIGETDLGLVMRIRLSDAFLIFTPGESAKLTANVIPDDAKNKSLTWTSNDETVATVDAEGNVTAVSGGETVITCTAADGSGISASCDVYVNYVDKSVTEITLSDTEKTIKNGSSITLTPTVAPEDATDKTVIWESDNLKVATVDENGKVTAVSAGTATITCIAADESGVTASCKVTVTQPVTNITLSDTEKTIKNGSSITLTPTVAPSDATEKNVTWKSDKPNVATVDENGKVTAVSAGTATITCTAADGSGVTASCKVTVTQPVTNITLSDTEKTVKNGSSITLTPTVAPSDATEKNVTWKSDKPNVAKVENGKVTAVSAGTATITCTAADGSGKTASCKVTVTQPVKGVTLNLKSKTLTTGKSVTLKAKISPSDATDKAVTWKSSNTKVAKVDKNGKVTAVGKGTAKITCTTKDGSKTATCSITVKQLVTKIKLNKTKATIKKGKKLTLKATVAPTNANNKKVKWKSSNTKVATVSSSGKVTAKKKGTATITCTAADGSGRKVTCKITVK